MLKFILKAKKRITYRESTLSSCCYRQLTATSLFLYYILIQVPKSLAITSLRKKQLRRRRQYSLCVKILHQACRRKPKSTASNLCGLSVINYSFLSSYLTVVYNINFSKFCHILQIMNGIALAFMYHLMLIKSAKETIMFLTSKAMLAPAYLSPLSCHVA